MKTTSAKLFLFLTTALFILSAGQSLSAKQIKTPRIVAEPYHSIDVSSGIELIVSRNTGNVILEFPANKTAEITTEVVDGVLVIKKVSRGGKSKGKYRVTVPAKEYKGISASSGCIVTLPANYRSDKTEINLAGGSILKGEIFCNTFSMNLSNGSIAELKGRCEEFTVTASGGSIAECYELAAGKVHASGRGGSILKIYVDKELKSYASSASIINYKGRGNVLAQEATSGAIIRNR